MAHFCMFGAWEAQPRPGGGIYVTIFGGSTLIRPSMARQIVETQPHPDAQRNREHDFRLNHFCLTVFGCTTVSWPTLAEEYLTLRDMLRSGKLTLDQWDQLLGRTSGDGPLRFVTFTLFGAFGGDEVPDEEKELDALSLQRHLGSISEDAAELLMAAIGQTGRQRLTAVRQAVAATLSADG